MPKIKTYEGLTGEEMVRRYTSDEEFRATLFSRRANRNSIQMLLQIFVIKGHLRWVQDMVDRRASLDKDKRTGMSPLFLASLSGRVAMVQFLIDRGADLNLKCIEGMTPLVAAAREGNRAIVKLLLNNGAKIDIEDCKGRTALHWACEKNDSKVVRLLLEYGADPNIVDADGNTPLIISAEDGRTKLVKLLLGHGVDLNDKVGQGTRVMILAIADFDMELVKTLLDLNLDPNHRWQGFTSIMSALTPFKKTWNPFSKRGKIRLSILRLLLEHGADPYATQEGMEMSAVNTAAITSSLDAMELLLDADIDVNEITAPGWPPLFAACHAARLDMVQFLLERGADLEIQNSEDESCLQHAVWSGELELVRFLVSKGARIDARDKKGITPLHVAVSNPNPNTDMVRVLVELGADVNAAVGETSNVLELASRLGAEGIVALLKAHGAQYPSDPNEPAEWARHVQEDIVTAARDGKLSIAIELLQHLEDREVRTANAGMVLKAAAARNDLGSVRNLVKGYPELNLEGALVEASYQGSTQLQEFLMKRHLKPDGIHTAIPCAEALRTAVLQGKGAAVKCLMKHSQDLTEDKELGPSLLEIAAQHGHSALLTMFLDKGFARDSGRLNRSGMSALREAVIKEDKELINRLLKEGKMSEEYVFHTQQPILITVVEKNDLRMAKKLLDAGAEIDIGGRGGTTPLITAAANGFPEMVELLLMRGADVNLRDEKGRTALDRAVARRRQPIVDLLRKSGARG